MKLVQMFVSCLVVLLLVSASPALAGGNGGSSKKATIKFKNNSSEIIAVTIDFDDDDIQEALENEEIRDFCEAGGKIVNPGATAKFKVKKGTYVVGAVDSAFNSPISMTIFVKKNHDVKVVIIDDPDTEGDIIFEGDEDDDE